MQKLGCGFGPYTTSEFIAATQFSPDSTFASIQSDANKYTKFWNTLQQTSSQYLTTQTCFYNPCDVLWHQINLFRSKLQVYRQDGHVVQREGSLKFYRSDNTKKAPKSKSLVLTIDGNEFGVGPFEWNEQHIRSGTKSDFVQQLLFNVLRELPKEIINTFNSWMQTYHHFPPQWAIELVQRSSPQLCSGECTFVAEYLVAALRGFSPLYLQTPTCVARSSLFVKLPGGFYVPRYLSELDFLLASSQELSFPHSTTELHCAKVVVHLQALPIKQ